MGKAGSIKKELFERLKSFLYIGGYTVLIYTYVMAPYVVEGKSMETTLHDRERVIVNKAIYYMSKPKGGEIIVLKAGDDVYWIKRVIAVAGDTVEAKNKWSLQIDWLVAKKRMAAKAIRFFVWRS
jgi:signal peptidase I